MGKYIFSLEKYREYRKRKENITDEVINMIVEFQDLEEFDGMDYDKMFKLGKLVIKDWCEYVEDDAIRI